MSDALKTLGQSAPLAATPTILYTVPALTETAVSTIIVCNQNAILAIKFRLWVAMAAAALTPSQYLFFDNVVAPGSSLSITIGITLATTDQLKVQTDTANVSFNAFGVEVT